MKTKLKIFLFTLLFFVLTPIITRAGVWEQSLQVDFERGTSQGDLVISNNEIRLIPGTIYENAEDGNTNDWTIFDNDPPGSITNIFDPERSNRVINLLSSDPINSYDTGFQYNAPTGLTNNLKNVQWKMKTSTRGCIYVVLSTTLGTRSMNYGPYLDTAQSGIYIRYSLGREMADSNWHTFTRNLENDLHNFEPENDIVSIRYIVARGNISIDDVFFVPENSIYTSPMLDLGENRVASLNRIIWEEEKPEGTFLTLQTRTSTDNSTWSDWSAEYDNSAGERITSTPQRYFQYRANINNNSNITAIPRLKRTLVEYNRIPNNTNNLLPANERRLSNTDNLMWDISSDSDTEDSITYTLEIDNNSDFGSLDSVTSRISSAGININQVENFTKLQDDTRYYWRVKVIDSQNNQSDYSSEEKFFILDKENQNPNPPNSGFNPNQKGIVKTQKPTIYWDKASDPDSSDTKDKLSYVIQLDENDKFDSAYTYNTEKNKTNFIVPENLTDNTQYYYKIKTKDDEDAESNWSDIQNFVVATGKNPIIAVSKTVGINANNKDQSSLLLGFVNNNINFSNINYIYWLIIILIITTVFFFLNKNILFNYILAPTHNKYNFNKKQKFNFLFAKSIRSLDGVNNAKLVATEVKGSRTKIVIAIIILIGIIALTLAGIYYYDNNPSPYKDDGKNVEMGDELTYRIDFENKGESSASNFNILDNIPEGTSYIKNSAKVNDTIQTDVRDNDLVTLDVNKLKFEFGELSAKSSDYISFRVKVENVPENNKIENVADILYGESNGIQNTNRTINYIENKTSIIGSIKGSIWNDSNNNKSKDKDEYGIGEVIVKLYEDKNNDNTLNEEDNSYLLEGITDSAGNYRFNNLTTGNYFVEIDEENLSDNSLITTENNPQLVIVNEPKEYSDINFGINSSDNEIIIEDTNNDEIIIEDTKGPEGSIGDLVWMDSDSSGSKDFGEIGLENVNIKLYEDSNDNKTLEFDQDAYVSLHKTDLNGNYQITGLSPKTYLILVEESTLPSEKFKLTTKNNPVVVKLESENQEFNDANFGYYIENAISKENGAEIETEDEYSEIPTIITSDEDYNRSETVSFTPIEISEEIKAGKIAPPVLTHFGPAQIENYNDKLSIPINKDLILKGKTGSNFTVTLFIHSELNLKTVTSANQEGIWEMIINTRLFEAGEHKIYAQSEDAEENLSAKVEIAMFKVNKDEKISEQFNYWLALGGLAIIAITIILTTWIKEKERAVKSKNKPKKKSNLKTKKIKNNARKVIKKPKSTRRKIEIK